MQSVTCPRSGLPAKSFRTALAGFEVPQRPPGRGGEAGQVPGRVAEFGNGDGGAIARQVPPGAQGAA